MDTDGAVSIIAAWLRESRAAVALTGAGVSAESGIPTFRDAMEGLWAEYDPQQLATPEGFEHDPGTVTRWYDWRRVRCLTKEPNPGHHALAELERRLNAEGPGQGARDSCPSGTRRFTLLTQNVDRLHQRAGSRNIVELHGTIHVWRCTKTGREVELPPEPLREFPPHSEWGGLLRPGVVWFGEMLPEAAVEAAERAIAACDLFLSIGTSALVYPAAGYVRMAKARGARVVEVNRDPTPITGVVDLAIQGLSGEVLPRIVAAMG